ncbi:TetR family transcriptional regulator [Cryptosporangium phraense]|uniref:TetR family transcriptional regulator n=1 Tax=Cryptosporangium phraense TaxID=2593070 RepID=A0A545AQ97_9ACTN|nr:TetR family transcriptional regulator [Cryptosporangium phraense]TQS43453.1 TetR family transcriptional regulator [Cryptosporangium phraense]
MPRWEHGSADRLKQAAMELFEEQGFDATSAVQIADRARVTTRTFFRYFPDKEEVLFADAEALNEALTQKLLQTPDVAKPLPAILRTLAGYDWASLGPLDVQRRRAALIASDPLLLERDLVKQQQLADGFRNALSRRGVDPEVAELAANTATQVFRIAYRQWLDGNGDPTLAAATDTAMSLLATIVPRTRRVANQRTALGKTDE